MKKLKWAEQKFRQVNFDYKAMKQFGFQRIKIGIYDHMIVHKKKRIIIKQAGFSEAKTPSKKYRIETLFISSPYDYNYQIQPFCHINKRKIKNNIDAFQEKIDPNFRKGYDIHDGNVGYYRNKLVMFDW
jgi:hypothetical protein